MHYGMLLSADDQYRLAWRMRPGGALEGLPAVRQRKGLTDDRAQLALVDQRGQPGQFGAVRVSTKNTACTPAAAAFSADGGALSVTRRPPRRVTS
jgi:hypothetical protein